jgi:hypothetical protein
MEMIIRARYEHAPENGAGSTENFLRWMPHLTDGDIQPLWPWVMSGQVESEHRAPGFEPERDRKLLGRIKSVQVWMGAGFLVLCGLMAARSMHPGAVLPALLPGALLALSMYGTDFSPTGMNYMLVFLSWVCALQLLHHNTVWLHGIFGVLTGLAWLTDVTAIFIVAAWLLAATLRWVWTSLRRGEQAVDENWIARNHFVGLVALVLGWVSVCGPRCGAAMDHWGRPLFSWHQHWMWLDNEVEALALADRYEEVRALENGRRMDLPGPSDYWKNHTGEQMRDRLEEGSQKVWSEFAGLTPAAPAQDPFAKSRARRQGFWLAGAAGLFAIAWFIVVSRRRRPDRSGVKPPSFSVAPALFTVLACAACGLWYAWYVPVRSDPRFLMVLYMPLVWSLVWGAEELISLARTRGMSARLWLIWRAGLWVITSVMVVDLVLLLRGADAVEIFAVR